MDLDSYQINLGIRVLGEDCFWEKSPSRSSLTFYVGHRGYCEDYKIDRIVDTVNGTAIAVDDADYKFDYKLPQLGLRADIGFDDMLKGLHGLIDVAYEWGDYYGKGYWGPTGAEWSDRTNGEGAVLRLGLQYQRGHVSFALGHEWIWLEGRNGKRTDANEPEFSEVDTNRMGFYASFALHF